MLAVQVQYWTLKEATRHNLAQEDLGNRTLLETHRHNVFDETEMQRHNYATEDETKRHNIATEQYYNNALDENIRHNIVSESQGYTNLGISERNAATNARNADTSAFQASTARFAAVSNYNLGLDANRISQYNADINSRNADTRWLDWTTSDKQADAAKKQAEAAYNNSLANLSNAETRKSELDLGYQNLELKEKQFNWDIVNDSVDNAVKVMNGFSNILGNVFKDR